MDDIEQGDGVIRLVRLQLADQMQDDARRRLAQRGPFALRLLHAIFAEHPLARVDQWLNGGGFMRLGHGDQVDVAAPAAGEAGGTINIVANVGKARGGGFDAVGRHGACYRRWG